MARESDEPGEIPGNLRRLAIFDERSVPAGLAGDPPGPPVLDRRTVALLQVAASVASGSPAVCLQWSTTRALAAGATQDQIADMLLAIARVTGLGRVVCAALWRRDRSQNDVGAALEKPADP